MKATKQEAALGELREAVKQAIRSGTPSTVVAARIKATLSGVRDVPAQALPTYRKERGPWQG